MTGMSLSRRRFLQSAALATAGAAVGPRIAGSAENKVLRIRAYRDIKILDPGYMIGGREITLQYACLAQLANYSPGDKWAWQPSYFVTALSQVDDLNIHFTLRPGIQWSNGFGELTSEDVKYSFERMKTSQWDGKWIALDHVEILDTYSGILHLNNPFAPIWYTTIADGTGTIVCKKAVEAVGGQYTTEFPAECGPYTFKKWIPKQRMELGLNPNWTGPKPDIEEIRLIPIEDEKTAELAYEAGEIDYTEISTEALLRYRQELPDNTTLLEKPGLRWTWMGMNTDHPKLQDIRVRRAIQYAIDVDTILAASYGGVSPRSRGIVPPGLLGHRTYTKFEKQDLDAARALMKEAGVSDLSLTIQVLNKTTNVTSATVIQANLAEIGIDLEVTPLESGVFWSLGLEADGDDWKDLQLWIMRFGDAADPSQMHQWYVESQVGVWNWERWKDPEFDELYLKGLSETDEAKRQAIYLRMQDIMEDTGAYVWITHEPNPLIHRNTFKPVVYPSGQMFLPWFEWT